VTGRHGWQSWDAYQRTHESNLERLPTFITQDLLTIEVGDRFVDWSGRIELAGGIEFAVVLQQQVRYRRDGRPEVRTRRYKYQAMVTVAGRKRGILRYDNSHARPEHPDDHHKHVRGPSGRAVVVHIGEANSPTLWDVIAELEKWVQTGEVARLKGMLARHPLAEGQNDDFTT